jgi:LuxR family glucitol operon transcriptional activator
MQNASKNPKVEVKPEFKPKPYERLGYLLKHMIGQLNSRRDEKMKQTLDELAGRVGKKSSAILYKWMDGSYAPKKHELEVLVDIGVHEALMDRRWVEDVMVAGKHPEVTRLMHHYFEQSILHNLPPRQFRELVGRKNELDTIMQRLEPGFRDYLIPIEGLGGVGKSSLALEVGWRCVETYDPQAKERHFDAVIWTSAKKLDLTPNGLRTQKPMISNMHDIYSAIIRVLNYPAIATVTATERAETIAKAFQQAGRVLLIIDNLETVEDPEVIEFLHNLPQPAKAIMTMRWHEDMPFPIRLKKLEEEEVRQLLQQESARQDLILTPKQLETLVEMTGGLPLAATFNLGMMATKGWSPARLKERTPETQQDLITYVYQEVIRRFREQSSEAYHALLALTFFDQDKGATLPALAATLGVSEDECWEVVQKGVRLNIINRSTSGEHLTILPLTRSHVLSFAAHEEAWLAEARHRWVNWYEAFAHQHSGEEWGDWAERFDKLHNEWRNLLQVFVWCAAHHHYETMTRFWVRHRLRQFPSVYGFWQDRLQWTAWLMREAEQREDWPIFAEMASSRGWMHTISGEYSQAEACFADAWQRRTHLSPEALCQLIAHRADLYQCRHLPQETLDHLQELEAALDNLPLDEHARVRQQINLHFYRGIAYFRLPDLATAEKEFQRVYTIGQEHKMSRAISKAQNWLADIAIVRGKWAEAERHLKSAQIIADRNHDRRRRALCRWSWTTLYEKRGRLRHSLEVGKVALHDFERLGMEHDAAELREQLRRIQRVLEEQERTTEQEP